MKDHHHQSRSSETFAGSRMSGGEHFWNSKSSSLNGLKHEPAKFGAYKGGHGGRKQLLIKKHLKPIFLTIALMGFFFLFDSLMVLFVGWMHHQNISYSRKSSEIKEETEAYIHKEKPPVHMYDRLLNMAANSLAEKEFKHEKSSFWKEPYKKASAWKPCADRKDKDAGKKFDKSNGHILVSANGGLNQQRVAICNALAVASLLNATLVLPRFLFSNVWHDPSQFGDIYQEEYFINAMKDEVDIVKELPSHMRSLDFEAIGSLITDADLVKEAKPLDYYTVVLPPLLKNGVVHLLGFGNRLGFDPLPSKEQRLRCKCNFHALKFVPKIQRAGSLLIQRIRKYDAAKSTIDRQLLGNYINDVQLKQHDDRRGPIKYLALHLRFEVDMVAYSACEFGGGEKERKELEAYREIHFPLLFERLKNSKPVSPAELRMLGRCPLTPEEAALVLAGLGFTSETSIYLAGSDIYGGRSKMQPLTSLYPNLITKEKLLTSSELAPFQNFSSQLAALDFIACASADVFAITDSGSQLSSLVSGFRTYYGGGRGPTLRPNKKRLAAIMAENSTISWTSFEDRIAKMIDEEQRILMRGFSRSIYRWPRCPDCMCKSH